MAKARCSSDNRKIAFINKYRSEQKERSNNDVDQERLRLSERLDEPRPTLIALNSKLRRFNFHPGVRLMAATRRYTVGLNASEVKENFACKSNIRGSNVVNHYERKMKKLSSFAEVDFSDESSVVFEPRPTEKEEIMKKKSATKLFPDENSRDSEAEPAAKSDQEETQG